MNVWISADLHCGHKNLVRGCSQWTEKYKCRNFETLEEHDNTIINNINKYIKENDIFYIIGDFSMGGNENIKKYRNLIKCKNIHFIIGNHDNGISKNCIFEDNTRAYDLFNSVQTRLEKKIGKETFIMDHYAMRTWHKASKGSIMLHGHSHNTLNQYERLLNIANEPQLYKSGEYFKQMDVGLESAYEYFKEYRPFHINEIRNIMKKRINLNIVYHE